MPLSSEITATGDKSSCTWAPAHTAPLSQQWTDATYTHAYREELFAHTDACTTLVQLWVHTHKYLGVTGMNICWTSRNRESSDTNFLTHKHTHKSMPNLSKRLINGLNYHLNYSNIKVIISSVPTVYWNSYLMIFCGHMATEKRTMLTNVQANPCAHTHTNTHTKTHLYTKTCTLAWLCTWAQIYMQTDGLYIHLCMDTHTLFQTRSLSV